MVLTVPLSKQEVEYNLRDQHIDKDFREEKKIVQGKGGRPELDGSGSFAPRVVFGREETPGRNPIFILEQQVDLEDEFHGVDQGNNLEGQDHVLGEDEEALSVFTEDVEGSIDEWTEVVSESNRANNDAIHPPNQWSRNCQGEDIDEQVEGYCTVEDEEEHADHDHEVNQVLQHVLVLESHDEFHRLDHVLVSFLVEEHLDVLVEENSESHESQIQKQVNQHEVHSPVIEEVYGVVAVWIYI